MNICEHVVLGVSGLRSVYAVCVSTVVVIDASFL